MEKKTYKLKQTFKDNDQAFDLVNTKNSSDVIPADPDGFFVDETYSEDDFEIRSASFVSDSGIGTMDFAFRKK